jgi:large subunit ribosomal protein L28
MSKVCQLTGKKTIGGNHVSHSNIKTKRKFYPNLQEKRFYVPELKQWVKLKVSTSAIRTINKKGVYNFIREAEQKQGIKII